MAKYILHFLLFLFLFISNISTSQVNYIQYTSSDGLAQTQVTYLMQDSKGYIWACTKGGVSRFDGHEFKNYTTHDGIKGNEVSRIYETEKGDIWIFTKFGLHKKVGEKFVFFEPATALKNFGECIYDSGKFYLMNMQGIEAFFYIFENGKYKLYGNKHKDLRIFGFQNKVMYSNISSGLKGQNEYELFMTKNLIFYINKIIQLKSQEFLLAMYFYTIFLVLKTVILS